MKKSNLVFAVVCLVSEISLARPVYLGMLKAKVPEASNVSCSVCHSGSNPPINLFAQDFRRLVKQATDQNKAFEDFLNLDSDKDGVSNGAELKGGTEPGVANKFTISVE